MLGSGYDYLAFGERAMKGGWNSKDPQFHCGHLHTPRVEAAGGQLVVHDAGLNRRGCPLESRRSSTTRMDDHPRSQLTESKCRSPSRWAESQHKRERVIASRMGPSSRRTRLYGFVVYGIHTIDTQSSSNQH